VGIKPSGNAANSVFFFFCEHKHLSPSFCWLGLRVARVVFATLPLFAIFLWHRLLSMYYFPFFFFFFFPRTFLFLHIKHRARHIDSASPLPLHGGWL